MKRRLLIALLGASSLAAGADAAAREGVVERAQEHVAAYDAARDRQDNEVYRAHAIALADTLEILGDFALASRCLERAGIIHYLRGEWDPALRVWDRGLRLARASEDPKRVAALLNAHAAGLDASGEHARAAVAFAELVEARRAIGDPRGEGIAWHNLAVAQRTSLRLPEAMDSIRRAMELHAEVGNQHGRASGFQALAQLLQRYGRLESARAAVDSAVTIAERLDYLAVLGPALIHRASMAVSDGELDRARVDAERAHRLMEDAGIDQQVGTTELLLAEIAIATGRPGDALDHVRRAEAADGRRASLTGDVYVAVLHGRALMHLGRTEEALEVLTGAAIEFERLESSLSEAIRQGEAAAVAGPFAFVAQLQLGAGRAAEAWGATEAGLARSLRRSIVGANATIALREFQSVVAQLDAVALVVGVATPEGFPVFLVSSAQVLAEWFEGPPAFWRDVRVATTHDADPAQVAAARTRLGRILLAPLEGTTPERLVVIPGGLAGLSFESLPWRGEVLGDQVAVSYSPSATVLRALQDREPAATGFFGAGAPRFVSPSVSDLRLAGLAAIELPGARGELRAISPGGDDVFVGADATIDVFRDRAANARVLHLATHAVVDGGEPSASGVLLVDAKGRPALLGVDDVSAMASRADLVTISACRAAGGYLVLGEGSFGLTRAFLESGARTVVSSWRDVEDDIARRFMELFYAELRTGKPRDVAALEARRRLRDEGLSVDQRSAFVVVGAVTGSLEAALARPSAVRWWRWIVPFFVLGGLAWVARRSRRPGRVDTPVDGPRS